MEHAAILTCYKVGFREKYNARNSVEKFFFTKNRYDLTIIISKVHINLDMLSLNISFDFTIINVS